MAIEDFKRRLRTYGDYIKIRDRYVDYALESLERLLEEKMIERMIRRRKLYERAGISEERG